MVQMLTKLLVADNSGAKKVKCIKVPGGAGKMRAKLGEIIVVSVQEAIPRSKVKKGEIYRAIIVRTAKELQRNDGSVIKFDENAVVLVNKNDEPIGTRVFGPVSRELRARNYTKIMSLAPEVL